METMAEQRMIAETIHQQLGGARLSVMTGAKDFVICESGLKFRLSSRRTRDKINMVQITLTPADLYRIEWMSIRTKKGVMTVDVVAEDNDVFVENLIPLFEYRTGLYTRL